MRYIAATFAIYSSPVSLSRLSLSLPRLELDLNFKRNATAHGLRDETVARGEGGEGKERERGREKEEEEKELSNLRVWRRIRVVVEDFEDEASMSEKC